MAEIYINEKDGKNVFNVLVPSGDTVTMTTSDTYVDKDIVITAYGGGGGGTYQSKTVIPATSDQRVTPDTGFDALRDVLVKAMPAGTAGVPIANKGAVSNHSIDIIPSVTNIAGYVSSETKTGDAVTVTAAELVSGSQTISTNTTTDVTNLKEVVTNVPPLIVTLTATIPTSGTNTISFVGLPSMPRAWTLDIAGSTQNVSWNNIYRCVSARYDGTKTYTYTAYKGNQGSATPYIYMVDNGSGFTQSYNNGTLTFTTNGTGSQTYCGPFLARTYVLMAICDNDGSTDIYRG